jgi:hypothetical protein
VCDILAPVCFRVLVPQVQREVVGFVTVRAGAGRFVAIQTAVTAGRAADKFALRGEEGRFVGRLVAGLALEACTCE